MSNPKSAQEGSASLGLRAAMVLTLAVIAGWAVCFWPARMLRGTDGVIWMSVAAFCCLIPGWIVVFLSRLAIFPNELVAFLASTFVRMGCVAGAALVVKFNWPTVGLAEFFGWLIGFYLLTLFLEARFLSKKKSQHPEQQAS
ncbi:MAG: hypothetical protein JNL58_23090 [Planctomyces sp.]|nr:hypothetical protein [Planctomyces sp.]